jgi:phytoene dehydrogenase-like protein
VREYAEPYSSIDCSLGGPPYPVSVVGLDRIANWIGLDRPAYEDKRQRWRDAIVAHIDGIFPGFASHVAVSAFSTASTMQSYLAAPAGAVYGFALRPPSGPIWRGAGTVAAHGPASLPRPTPAAAAFPARSWAAPAPPTAFWRIPDEVPSNAL